MGVQLTIELGNAAFEDGNRDWEVARIVREVADKVEDGGPGLRDSIKAYDVNGNGVGSFKEVPIATNPDESSFVMLHIGELGNAAFEDAGPAFEVARIFREAADRIENGDLDFVLRDVNGNRVGHVSATVAEPEDELDAEADDDDSGVKPYTKTPIYGDKVVDRYGNEWTVGAVGGVETSKQVNPRTGFRDRSFRLWLLSEDGNDTLVTRVESDLLDGLKESIRTLEYVINLDERGEFCADVREQNGETIYVIKGHEIFEDGFMRNSKDIGGLKDYLQGLKVIGENDSILDTNRFQEWEREIDQRFDRALATYNKASELSWFGTIKAADSQRALLQSIGAVLIEDSQAGRDGDRATYLVRMDEAAHEAFGPYVGEFEADLHAITEYEIERVVPDQHDDRGLAAHIAYLKFEAVAAADDDVLYVQMALKAAQAQVAERAQAAAKPASPANGADHGNEP